MLRCSRPIRTNKTSRPIRVIGCDAYQKGLLCGEIVSTISKIVFRFIIVVVNVSSFWAFSSNSQRCRLYPQYLTYWNSCRTEMSKFVRLFYEFHFYSNNPFGVPITELLIRKKIDERKFIGLKNVKIWVWVYLASICGMQYSFIVV